MPIPSTVDEFLEIGYKSGVLEKQVATSYLDQLRGGPAFPDSARPLDGVPGHRREPEGRPVLRVVVRQRDFEEHRREVRGSGAVEEHEVRARRDHRGRELLAA